MNRIEVLRDGLGVPHARAGSVRDAFFAQGYVHAQDRLWQMILDRARAAGRSAELLGPTALRMDAFCRRLGLAETARADYDVLDARTKEMLDAYADGVNAYVEQARELPVELAFLGVAPEPWEPWHCGAVMKVRHVFMGSYGSKLWRAHLQRTLGREAMVALGSPRGREDVLIVPVGGRARWAADPPPAAEGSNSWAVHGSRTASGLPLVAGDPHRALEVPNVYYQNHIACPDFDAIGLSICGVPGLFHFGHNAHVAWCVTHAMADTQDLYLERFEGGRYEYRGDWRPALWRQEVLRVRGAEDVGIQAVRTHHGPVVFGDPSSGEAISMRWTATDVPNTTLACVLPMLVATAVDELEEAQRGWVDPCNNLLMADRQGTIAYLHRGRVPVRHPANGWGPVPGWTGGHEWEGDVPFEALPRLRNPRAGYIVTANNRVCGDDYAPYLGMDYGPPFRAQRILERLEALERAEPADMASIHADRLSIPSRALVGRVNSVVEWDGVMEPSSAGAAVYAVLREKLAELILEREPFSSLRADAFPDDPAPKPLVQRVRAALPRLMGQPAPVASWDELSDEALERAIGDLKERLGPDPAAWRWDAIHTTRIRHPLGGEIEGLDPPSVACGGDAETVNTTGWDVGLDVTHSSVARYVFDLSDWDRSGWVIPLGSSGDPRSPHYADQAGAWARVELCPMTYSWEAIEREARTATLLRT